MPLYSFEGVSPTVHPDAWIAPTAVLIGDVVVEKDVSIWYGAVIRADFGRITIREGSNIQDNAVLHVGMHGCDVGPNATVGHLCLVHDCFVGEQALIGNGSTVLDGARIGDRSVVAAGATVTPGMVIPPDTVAMGSPAKKHVPVDGHAKLLIEHNAEIYRELARRHAAGIAEV